MYTDWTVLCVWDWLMTDFSHMSAMLDDAYMKHGLYPFFHLVLLNDFVIVKFVKISIIVCGSVSPCGVVAVEIADYNVR